MASAWQQPYVNIFKAFGAGQWKKCTKEGDVSSVMDRKIKSTVYRISGPVPTGNYLQFPRISTQSLYLTGHFLYIIFKPISGRFYVIHTEVATEGSLPVRISLSNLFKELKASSTWLQLPIDHKNSCEIALVTSEHTLLSSKPAPENSRWTLLALDLRALLSDLLQLRFSHVKTLKLCANMCVKGAYTSNIDYSPGTPATSKTQLTTVECLPREMLLPVTKGLCFTDVYCYVTYPPVENGVRTLVASISSITRQPVQRKENTSSAPVIQGVIRGNKMEEDEEDEVEEEKATDVVREAVRAEPIKVAHSDKKVTKNFQVKIRTHSKSKHKGPPAEPLMRLRRVIGTGGHTSTAQVLFSSDGSRVYYPCHSTVIGLDTSSGDQQFYLGHTDKVTCIALSGDSTLLASAQSHPMGLVRIWRTGQVHCFVVFKALHKQLNWLSFSNTGTMLCGVGKGGRGKTLVVFWDTSRVDQSGEVDVLTKVYADVSIERMRVANFDDNRMVSCGMGNIRFWRLKDRKLKSCAVKLNDHHRDHFIEVLFQHSAETSFVYSCTSTGHMFELCHKTLSVIRDWKLFHDTPKSVCVVSMATWDGLIAIGSEDGLLCVWTTDSTSVALETEHEGPVTSIGVSSDGKSVLAASSAGTIGLLDVPMKSYHTLVRSHTQSIVCMGMSPRGGHLVTGSKDCTIRIWDLETTGELVEFESPGDPPSSVCYHPLRTEVVCGFTSGAVRAFDVLSASMMVEHRHHQGGVTSVLFSPDGLRLYSSGADGSLTVYDSSQKAYPIGKVVYNIVAKGAHHGPKALSVSHDGTRLAFIGPQEYIITIVDGLTLNEVLRVDIMPTTGHSAMKEDTARHVLFSPDTSGHIAVLTKRGHLLKYSAQSGQLLSHKQAPVLQPGDCSAMAASRDGRLLFTAGQDHMIKVWDYTMSLDTSYQVFLGHCEAVSQLIVSQDNNRVISCGECLFLWDMTPFSSLSPASTSPPSHTVSVPDSPRKNAPSPISYEPLRTESFTSPVVEQAHKQEEEEEEDEGLRVTSSSSVDSTRQEESSANTGSEVTAESSTQLAPPTVKKHYRFIPPSCVRPQQLYVAPDGGAGLSLARVIGFNQHSRNGVAWHPPSAKLFYTSGSIVVLENLSSGEQHQCVGHPTEVSTLALSHDGLNLASSSARHSTWSCEIRIWAVNTSTCIKVLEFHSHTVTCMAYSPDDRYLLSVGGHPSASVVIWSTVGYTQLVASAPSAPVHDARWDPYTAYELATVGTNGHVAFWLLQHKGGNDASVELKVHEPQLPHKLSAIELEFTSLCYGARHSLYIATNSGLVTVWDTRENSCTMFWETACTEIGVMAYQSGVLMVGGANSLLQLWSVGHAPDTPNVNLEKSLEVDGGVFSGVFDNRMEQGVVGTDKGTVWSVNWSECRAVKIVSSHSPNVNSAACSVDGQLLATGGDDGGLVVWSTMSWDPVIQFNARKACTAVAVGPWRGQQDHSSSSSVVCAGGYEDGTVRLFSVHVGGGGGGGGVSGHNMAKLTPHKSTVTCVAMASHGDVLLSGCADGVVVATGVPMGVTLKRISDHTGAPITAIDVRQHPMQLPELSPTPLQLWLAASHDRRVSVWAGDWERGRCQLFDWLTFPAPASAPDGTTLKRGNQHQWKLLPPTLAQFSPTHHDTIIYCGYGPAVCVQFYSLTQRTIVQRYYLNHWPMSMSVSHDSHLIAFGTVDQVLVLMDYDIGSFQEYCTHNDSVTNVLLSRNHDRPLLVSTSRNCIHIWNVLIA